MVIHAYELNYKKIEKENMVSVKKKNSTIFSLKSKLISYSGAWLRSAPACSISLTHSHSNLCLELQKFKNRKGNGLPPQTKASRNAHEGGPYRGLALFVNLIGPIMLYMGPNHMKSAYRVSHQA